MFRSIGGQVKKREGELQQSAQKNTHIDAIVRQFLFQTFGEAAQRLAISVSLEKNTLIVQTNNKIIAQEIVFQSRELYRILREQNLRFERIVIR